MSASLTDDYRAAALQTSWKRELRYLADHELEAEREYISREMASVLEYGEGLIDGPTWKLLYAERLAWLQYEVHRRQAIAGKYWQAPNRLPIEYIERIRRELPLHELIIHDYPDTKMKKTGIGYAGHCPFHVDKTPSLMVWTTPDPPHWFCFSCTQGGSVFDWLMVSNQARDFADAVRKAGEWLGLPPPGPAVGGVVEI